MKPTSLSEHRWLLLVAALAASCGCNEGTQAGAPHSNAEGEPSAREGSEGSASGGTTSGDVTPNGLTSEGVTSSETTSTEVTPPGGTPTGTPSGGPTVGVLTVGAGGDGDSLDPESELPPRKVKVGVHASLSGFSAASAADKLQRMNVVLAKNGSEYSNECSEISGDIDVGVQFALESFETFAVGDGDIDTEEEYTEVAELPYDFKIVRSISWCDCTQTEHPEILGCAAQKKAVVVALPDYGVEPIVWAHEYGHFAGLRHSTDLGNVMHSHASRCKVHVDAVQRALYRVPIDEELLATCSYAVLAVVQPAESDAELEDQLREFVTATHVHGLSYEQARAFGARPHALPFLLTLLEDSAFREHHDQIALALGAIGGEPAIERLKALVEDSRLDRDSLPAVRAALPALGWALSSPEADAIVDKTLEFLAERTKAGFWKEGVAGLSADELDAVAADLVARAAMGLAFAGKNVRDSLKLAFAGAEDEQLQALFQHLKRVNQAIQESERGDLASYYAGR